MLYKNLEERSPHFQVWRNFFKNQHKPSLSGMISTFIAFIRIIRQRRLSRYNARNISRPGSNRTRPIVTTRRPTSSAATTTTTSRFTSTLTAGSSPSTPARISYLFIAASSRSTVASRPILHRCLQKASATLPSQLRRICTVAHQHGL